MGHGKLSEPHLCVLRKATRMLPVPVCATECWFEDQETLAPVPPALLDDLSSRSLCLSFSICKKSAGLLASL